MGQQILAMYHIHVHVYYMLGILPTFPNYSTYTVVLKIDMTMINTVAASNCTMHTGLHGTSHNFNFYVSNINIQRPSNIPDNIIINYTKI